MNGMPRLAQISFKVPSLDALREMFRRVNEAKCNRIFPVNHGNAWSVYFEDPEGNTIECYLDTPFYVAQPHTGYLDLSKTDAEIVRDTEAACKDDPYFMPVGEWEAKMAEEGVSSRMEPGRISVTFELK